MQAAVVESHNVYNAGGDLDLEGGTVTNNKATHGNGGGVWTAISDAVTFNLVSVTDNRAQKSGGVYITQSGSGAFVDCTIQSNTATILGNGLVYKTGATYSLSGSEGSCQSLDNDP